jgi:exodeoxyribonuclease-1
MQEFHDADWTAPPEIVGKLQDKRARELGYRIIFLEKPELLRPDIRHWYEKWQLRRLVEDDEDLSYLTLGRAIKEAQELSESSNESDKKLMADVTEWLRLRLDEVGAQPEN